MIPFNKPYLTGREMDSIRDSFNSLKFSGNGSFTKKCEAYFESSLSAKKCLLTTSCSDALEMSAILCNLESGDEVIVPSYTFVSSALAFVREKARIVFADSRKDTPCIDETKIEDLITPRTKVIVVVHYAGVSCEMDTIMEIARKYNLIVIEDAAQGFDSFYKGKPLGSIGHMAAFSFHETKNIQCGEGGLLAINDERFVKRAEIVWEKGTNRAEFFRGEINKYGWKDIGSSFLPAEYVAAFLWAQLESAEDIQIKRKDIWERYYNGLKNTLGERIQPIPAHATNNAHMFYFICDSLEERSSLINYLSDNGVKATFHYLSLHKSDYMEERHYKANLPYADYYSECLIRLPFYYEMSNEDIDFVTDRVKEFYINTI